MHANQSDCQSSGSGRLRLIWRSTRVKDKWSPVPTASNDRSSLKQQKKKKMGGERQKIEPFLMSILSGRFGAITKEMSNTLMRSGRSTVLKTERIFPVPSPMSNPHDPDCGRSADPAGGDPLHSRGQIEFFKMILRPETRRSRTRRTMGIFIMPTPPSPPPSSTREDLRSSLRTARIKRRPALRRDCLLSRCKDHL